MKLDGRYRYELDMINVLHRYGDREPTVNNLGAKVDAGLMSQCFGKSLLINILYL